VIVLLASKGRRITVTVDWIETQPTIPEEKKPTRVVRPLIPLEKNCGTAINCG
jgi:hypothetical protein